MRRRLLLAAAALLGACAAPRPAPAPGGAGGAPAAAAEAPSPEVRDPNLVLVVSESVPDPADDGGSFTKVFVDGEEAGRTAAGPRSETRVLKLKLPAGNRPVRLEQWVLPPEGDWTRLDEARQPRERFVRIEDGSTARLELRFAEGAASHTLTVSREPLQPL